MKFKSLYEADGMLFEYTHGELTKMSDGGRKLRSKGMPAYYKGLKRTKDKTHIKTIWNVDSATIPDKTYKQIVEVIPKESNIFAISTEDWNLKRFSDVIKNSDVNVYCSCPDFLWGGEKYNLGPHGSYEEALARGNISDFFPGDKAVVTIPPDVRDPGREHVLCKHLLAVSKVFNANTSNIMSDAKNRKIIK
jgi:hypothetical protein